MKRWESDLLDRPPEVKNSGLGRAATNHFKQVKSSMKSFFKGYKSGSIHIDVVGGISKIVFYLKHQECYHLVRFLQSSHVQHPL